MKKSIAPENLTRALLQLNLTDKEIKTYLVLLESGGLAIRDISLRSGINRVTAYSAIDELKSKGLAAESRRGKRKLFVAEDPETLKNLIDEKAEKLEKEKASLENIILPALKAINVNQLNKPQFKFFEGDDGIGKVYDEYILKSREAINCGSYDTAIKASSYDWEIKYFQDIKKSGVFFRFILEDTGLNRKMAEAGKGIAHFKFLPEGTRVSADIVAFGDSVALVSYDRKATTLIEDASIAQAIRMYLDFMWERL